MIDYLDALLLIPEQFLCCFCYDSDSRATVVAICRRIVLVRNTRMMAKTVSANFDKAILVCRHDVAADDPFTLRVYSATLNAM
jgi:hypothetical protein